MRHSLLAAASLVLLAAAPSLDAQAPLAGEVLATRTAIERRVADEERAAQDPSTTGADRMRHRFAVELLRARLRDGDFRPGDQVILSVGGDSVLSDTFVVRAGPVLPLPTLPEIPLAGVLRSELQAHAAAHLARYIRRAEVHAIPLIRVAVLGEVNRPGYYAVPADLLVGDLIMRADGPSADADLARLHVRRDNTPVWGPGELRSAISSGFTLDQLHIQAGDELVVGERRRTSMTTVLQAVGVATGLVAFVLSISN
jgi:protein involved in polysaccharide export with SLBB domain